MAALPDYLDRDGLLKYFPTMRDGGDVLTVYVLSIAGEAGYPIPDAERDRMEQALLGFVEGRVVRDSALPTADLALRKLAALEALSRRAEPLEPEWLEQHHDRAEPLADVGGARLVPILQRRRSCRDATSGSPKRSRSCARASTSRARRWASRTEKRDALWWLMVSADVNAARCSSRFDDVPAVAGRRAAPRARRARPPQRGALGHDGRQRLGRRRAGQVLRALRGHAGDGHDDARRSRGEHVRARVGRRRREGAAPRSSRGPTARANVALAQDGSGRAVGHGAERRRDPAQGAAVERLPHRAHDRARSQQKAEEQWQRGDVARVRARDRRADRHDVGRGRRSDCPRARPRLGTRPRRRLAASRRRASAARAPCGPPSSSARSRPSAPTTATCRRARSSRSTPCASTTRAASACRHARRGDVRAGDVRRDRRTPRGGDAP